MINTIFLDMDGVITNFNKAVCDEFGLPCPPKEYNFFEEIRSQVNEFCNTSFWRHLEWEENGRDILRAIMDTLGLEKIYFLTGMMPNLETASGKMMWIRDNLPIYSNRVILTTLEVPKAFLARPNALLIDDYDKCTKEFIDAGGQAILVPRTYNRLSKKADQSSQYVRECLEKLI